MQYIANNITSNIRELEGSLNKLIALANLENKPIDIPLAAEALKDMISPNNTRKLHLSSLSKSFLTTLMYLLPN